MHERGAFGADCTLQLMLYDSHDGDNTVYLAPARRKLEVCSLSLSLSLTHTYSFSLSLTHIHTHGNSSLVGAISDTERIHTHGNSSLVGAISDTERILDPGP